MSGAVVMLGRVQPLVADLILLRAAQAGELRIAPGRARRVYRVNDDDAENAGRSAARPTDGQTHTLSLRYETPVLGAVDLRLVLGPGSLKLSVTLAPGRPVDLATQSADQLRQALGDQLSRAVELTILPRREPLDVYA